MLYQAALAGWHDFFILAGTASARGFASWRVADEDWTRMGIDRASAPFRYIWQ
jgi:hypothetical protein